MNNSAIKYSQTTDGICDSNIHPTGITRQDTSDSLELPSLAKQTRPMFDVIPDHSMNNNDFETDDHNRRRTETMDSMSDDQQSISSAGKSRRMQTKLLRSFHNIGLKKKTDI